MKQIVPRALFGKVIDALVMNDVKSAVHYESSKLVVKATWRHKPKARNTREECVVTFGVPNYLERKFVKLLLKAGEPFPLKKVQLKAWPKKRKIKVLVK